MTSDVLLNYVGIKKSQISSIRRYFFMIPKVSSFAYEKKTSRLSLEVNLI